MNADEPRAEERRHPGEADWGRAEMLTEAAIDFYRKQTVAVAIAHVKARQQMGD